MRRRGSTLWATRSVFDFFSSRNTETQLTHPQIDAPKKQKKLTSAELRKKKKDRMARRKRGEEVFSDEED